MKKIKIITSDSCSYCIKAKQLLQSKNIDYEEIDILDAHVIMREYTLRTVPQIFVDDKLLTGGYTALKEYFNDK